MEWIEVAVKHAHNREVLHQTVSRKAGKHLDVRLLLAFHLLLELSLLIDHIPRSTGPWTQHMSPRI